MRLDLQDERLRVRLTGLCDGRSRLVIDYPAEPHYRQSIYTALAELLRPRWSGNSPSRNEEEALP